MATIAWQSVKPILMQILGYAFLVLGVLGMFLPILQGFLFLFIGLLILAKYAPWAQRLLDHLEERYPRFGKVKDQAEGTMHRWGEWIAGFFRGRPSYSGAVAASSQSRVGSLDQLDQIGAHPGMVVVEPGALLGIQKLRQHQPAIDRRERERLEAQQLALAAGRLRRG